MKSSEIISYWNGRNLTAANNTIIMFQFVGLYALKYLLQKINANEEVVIRVKGRDETFYPLVDKTSAQETVKEAVKKTYDEYRQLYKISQVTTKELKKFIKNGDKIFSDEGIHYYYTESDIQGKMPTDRELLILSKERIFIRAKADKQYLKNFVEMYSQTIMSVSTALENGTGDISIISESCFEKIQKFSKGKNIIREKFDAFERFKEQAGRTPDNIALICANERLTYKELNERIREYVKILEEFKIGSGDRVILVAENSIATIVALYAIWAVKAIYIPASESYSKEKIIEMAKEVQPKAIIKDSVLTLTDYNGIVHENNDISHIILTSGTTGKPKMAAIDREGFGNLCEWYKDTFEYNEQSKVLLLTNFLFDASVKNLVVSFMTGGSLILPDTELYDSCGIAEIIEKEKITHINSVPSLIEKVTGFADTYRLSSLKWLILGGEGFRIDRKKTVSAGISVANVYGPTEATDLVTCYILEDDDRKIVPIGKPIANKKVFILDEKMRCVPPYVRGDIYISGTGVIERYLNVSPEGVFFDNPYAAGEKMYKTGDVGMWNESGEILYLGRCDNQIKMNGQRVELEEIEGVARCCEGISEVSAVQIDNRLIICYTCEKNKNVEKEKLKKEYLRRISRSLQPNDYHCLDRMPYTLNGKIDRKAIVTIIQNEKTHIVTAENEKERLVLEAWRATLGIDRISTDSPFFEIGGNSLLLNKLKIEIDKRIENSLSITDFFEYGTIKKIAERI